MTMVKIGILQRSVHSSSDKNRVDISNQIESLAKEGSQLIVLSELHDTKYFCQTENVDNFKLASTIPGEPSEFYSNLAKENAVVLVCSMFEKRTEGLYHNTAVVFDKDGTVAGKYRKMHIPDDPGYYEKFYFTPGDLGFKPIQTSLGKLGVLICWDQWYPEAARLMALSGAEILIYPTAIGWSLEDDEEEKTRQLNAWKTIQKSHAIANGIPVVSVNRSGFEGDPSDSNNGIDFWGNSFVAGQQGESLLELPKEENVAFVEVDLGKSEKVKQWWPFLRDRRIESYDDLKKRFID